MMHGTYVGMIRLINFWFRIRDAKYYIKTDFKIYPGTTSLQAHAKLAIPEHVPVQAFRLALKLHMPDGCLHSIYEFVPYYFSSTHVTATFLLPVEQMLCHPGNWVIELFLPHIECKLGGWCIPVPKCAAIEDDLDVIHKSIVSIKDGLPETLNVVHGIVDDVLFVAELEPKVYPVSAFTGVTAKAKLTRIVDNFVTHSADAPLMLRGTTLHTSISIGDVKNHEGDWQVECLIGSKVIATHRFQVVARQRAIDAITVNSMSLVAESASGEFIPINETICFASETLNVIPGLKLNTPYPSGFASYTLSMKVFRDGNPAGEWKCEVVFRDKIFDCELPKIPIPEPVSKDGPADYKVCIYLDERQIIRTGFRVRPRPPELPRITRLLLSDETHTDPSNGTKSPPQLGDNRKPRKRGTTRRKKGNDS